MASFSVEWDEATRAAAVAAVAEGLVHFTKFEEINAKKPVAACLGSGRFLRGTVVPMLEQLEYQIVLAQPRGRAFVDDMAERADGCFEVDTVAFDGSVTTKSHRLHAVGSLGQPEAREEFLRLPYMFPTLSLLVVGVSEAGLVPDSQAANDMAELLYNFYLSNAERSLSVWSTDDVPRNGELLKKLALGAGYLGQLPQSGPFEEWVRARVTFHNSMLDRITGARPDEPLVPRCEPLPLRAVVVEDLVGALPEDEYPPQGFLVRRARRELERDLAVKARVASVTQMALAFSLALAGQARMTEAVRFPQLAAFVERLFRHDLLSCVIDLDVPEAEAQRVFDEWLKRLRHAHFGQSTLFLCQNAMAKVEQRLLPTVAAVLAQGGTPSGFVAALLAVALRFATPWHRYDRDGATVYVGHLPPGVATPGGAAEEYAPGLCVDWAQGTYEFLDVGETAALLAPLARQPSSAAAGATVSTVLGRMEGFNMGEPAMASLSVRVAVMYDALVRGAKTPLALAEDVLRAEHVVLWLPRADVEGVVRAEVASAKAVDVRTALLPPAHGELMRWGVDALLTEPPLVAEYLGLGRDSADEFAALARAEQADRVWTQLFVRRSPLSAAALGVVEALTGLGLGAFVAQRDLGRIRAWYAEQQPEAFMRKALEAAGVRYVVMDNSPFDALQAPHWRAGRRPPPQMRAALNADEIFAGNWPAVAAALQDGEYAETLSGLHEFLRGWIGVLDPEFITAELGPGFQYPGGEFQGVDDVPSAAELLDDVLLPLAEQAQLPVALRLTAPELLGGAVRQLLRAYPGVRFLVSGAASEAEACALAAAFPNLHVHGVATASQTAHAVGARLEALGTGFTAVHSAATVLEHLPARWRRARRVVADVLVARYSALAEAGWQLSRDDIRRDVQRVLGGSYEGFVSR